MKSNAGENLHDRLTIYQKPNKVLKPFHCFKIECEQTVEIIDLNNSQLIPHNKFKFWYAFNYTVLQNR